MRISDWSSDVCSSDLLLVHPEVLVEALRRYEQQQQAAEARRQAEAIAALAGQLTADPRDPVIGNPQGDVTLVEFFDYRCGYCKRMTGTLAKLIEEDPQLRVVMKEFPILSQQSATEIGRAEEHTSELQSLMRISYAVFCLKKK